MLGRSLPAWIVATLSLGCSLTTDFSGVTDGSGGASGAGGGSSEGPDFPRLALYETSNPKSFDDPLHQEQAARFHIGVMGIYPGWEDSHAPVAEVVQKVKQHNPEARLFVTVSPHHFRGTASGDAYQEVIDKLDAEKWWLYDSGTSGTKVPWPSADYFATNLTPFTAKDAAGLNFAQWVAGFTFRTYFEPTPGLDGFVLDSLDWRARVSGDYDVDGDLDDANAPLTGQWYRQGARQYLDEMKELAPDELRLGQLQLDDSSWTFTELEGALHGGVVPYLIGQSYSVENEGWSAMLATYRAGLAVTAPPKLVVFQMRGEATDYQAFRYGFASCLLDDGYFAFDTGSWGIVWFDEYDFELGQATTPPPTAAWKDGVWRRDFENGMALVNPRGNGSRTLELEAPFQRLKGTQAPSVNDGSETTSVTLAERDGLILRRTAK